MPPAPSRRQPDSPGAAWFQRESSLGMLHEVQRDAVPELTRVFGHTGLYLRPTAALPPVLSGNMLANVVSLHRQGDRMGGQLECGDARLPFASEGLSLVYGLFIFESSPDPLGLLSEVVRVLRPEGVALLLTLNPWSPTRLRWGLKGLRPQDPSAFAAAVRQAGLEVQRRRYVGPTWAAAPGANVGREHSGPGDSLRMASLVVARRREAGVTPLRLLSPALKFRPGMSAG